MLAKISRGIDWFSTKQGDWTALLILPLLGVVLYEVMMRYGFNAPTIWVHETASFLGGRRNHRNEIMATEGKNE